MSANPLDSLTFDKLVPTDSKYLRKEDFDEDGEVVTIKGFKYEDIKTDDGGLEQKTVLYLEEHEKGLVLNRTNASLIPICTGAKTAGDARGKRVVIYVDPTVGYGGKVVGGLRLKKVPGAPKQRPAAAAGVDFNDEVPF